MLTKYLDAAMRHAHYEMLADDGSIYGEISACRAYTPTQLLWRHAGRLAGSSEERLYSHPQESCLATIDGLDRRSKKFVA